MLSSLLGSNSTAAAAAAAAGSSSTIDSSSPGKHHRLLRSPLHLESANDGSISSLDCHSDLSPWECERLQEYVQDLPTHPTLTTRHLKANPAVPQNGLILLLQFSDHTSRALPPAFEYQLLWNIRIAHYLQLNSYQHAPTWWNVIPWHTTPRTEISVANTTSGRSLNFQTAVHPLLDALDTFDMDWSVYDPNGDGRLDHLVVLHSGYAAELGGVDCTNQRGPEERIWRYERRSVCVCVIVIFIIRMLVVGKKEEC